MHHNKRAAALAHAFDAGLAQAITRYQRRVEAGPDVAGPFIRQRARALVAESTPPRQAISRACRDFEQAYAIGGGAGWPTPTEHTTTTDLTTNPQ